MKKNFSKLIFLILTILCLAVLDGCFNSSESNFKAEIEALAAAKNWLVFVDSLNFVGAFQNTAKVIQKESKVKDWEFAFNEVFAITGQAFLRKVKEKQYFTSLPGFSEGEYVVIVFHTTFVKREETLETVILTKEEDGNWRVLNYYIK